MSDVEGGIEDGPTNRQMLEDGLYLSNQVDSVMYRIIQLVESDQYTEVRHQQLMNEIDMMRENLDLVERDAKIRLQEDLPETEDD